MKENNKCVYVYLDHRKQGKYIYDDLEFGFEPIYVGKGNLNRPNRHRYLYKKHNTRFYSKIQSIFESSNILPDYIIYKSDLTEDEANNLEVELIRKIGRIENGGILTNLSDGGEGQSGWKMSEESKLKKSISMTGKKFGTPSDETKRNISNANKGRISPNKDKKMSEEQKKKISASKKGKYLGENNANYGRVFTDEQRKNISEKNKGRLIGENNPNYKNKNHINVVAKDTWELININGEIIIIESLNRYCRENYLSINCMKDIWNGRRKSIYKNWIKVTKLTNNVKNKKSE